jgi:rsbT co-antagonist protein RsbR
MSDSVTSRLSGLIDRHAAAILDNWVRHQLTASTLRPDLMNERELRSQSTAFLRAFHRALADADTSLDAPAWAPVRDFIGSLSVNRAEAGYTPSQTATFIFSLKQPLFDLWRSEVADAAQLSEGLWTITRLLDALGLEVTELYQKQRNAIIVRQQHELLELSTPVVSLWQGVLAVPLIGTLDSARTQVVMENLLQRIVDTGAGIAIIDITGVPTVDTMVAQHLLKTVAAARLMGADCIISGIRPQIAQTIVHLGVELGTASTKATLADAFALALRRNGLSVQATAAAAQE